MKKPKFETSVRGDEMTVKVTLPKRSGKDRRQRVYTEAVLEAVKELHPGEVVESVLKTSQVRHDDLLQGEWKLKLLREKKVEKKLDESEKPKRTKNSKRTGSSGAGTTSKSDKSEKS